MAEWGHVEWPNRDRPIWAFNWTLAGYPDEEGISVSQVHFLGQKVLWKASLPSLRVQYDAGGGPYKDPINYDNARTTALSPSKRVRVYSYVSHGMAAVALDSYHRIGEYRLTHRWVFWENGDLYPRLYSAGLQHEYNHRHHAYWRFDFDIGGAANDLVLEYNNYTADQGFGRGWHPKTTEISRRKSRDSNRIWAVMDKATGRGYKIVPGPHDGVADEFSTRDLWVMRYRPNEDKHGRQGTAWNDELAPYLNGERVDGQDVVLWYCGHLAHEASDGGDEWHHAGPLLFPIGNWW